MTVHGIFKGKNVGKEVERFKDSIAHFRGIKMKWKK